MGVTDERWANLSPNEMRSQKRARGPACLPGAPIREFAQNTIASADGKTLWQTHPHEVYADIVDPGLIDPGHPSSLVPAENSSIALFRAFFSEAMLQSMVAYTNVKIAVLRSNIVAPNCNLHICVGNHTLQHSFREE